MSEPAQPQPADQTAPAQPATAQPDQEPGNVTTGQPVTIEPVTAPAGNGTSSTAPGPATSPEPSPGSQDGPADDSQPPGNAAAAGFPGEEPLEASPAEAQAAGHDTQPADEGPAEPGPGGAGASPVVPGAPAEVVGLEGKHVTTQLRTGGATSNESPSLPQNIQSSGAKAHAGLDLLLKVANDAEESAEDKLPQVVAIAEALRADLDRYVPESIRHVAMADVERLLARLHL